MFLYIEKKGLLIKYLVIGLSLTLCSCVSSNVHRGVQTVASEQKEDWKEQRQTTEVVNERIQDKMREQKRNETDWSEVAFVALNAANSTLQQHNQTLTQQNAKTENELRRLQFLNAQKKNKTVNQAKITSKETSDFVPKQETSYTASTNYQGPQENKKTTIVVGTPTYSVGSGSNSNNASNTKQVPSGNLNATLKMSCANFSDVNGLTCRFEKVAICKENKAGFWFCQGHLQYTQAGEKGDKGLRDNLHYAGCKFPHSRTELADSTYLYYCDEPWRQGGAESASISTMES